MLLMETCSPRLDLNLWKQSMEIITWFLCCSLPQVSLAEGHKFDRDVELLIFYRKVHSPSVAVEMGMSGRPSGIFFLIWKFTPSELTLP
jgi:hypothetical protein